MKKIISFIVLLTFLITPSLQAGEDLKKAPKLPKRAIWLNAPKDKSFKEFKGQVTLLDFWSYASINSIRSLDYIKKWNEVYKSLGLEVIGIHAPSYSFEYKKENVKEALKRLGINYPVMLDNNFKTWKKFEVFLWPTQYLVNDKGQIVYQHVGEGDYRGFEEKIRRYLAEANPLLRFPPFVTKRGGLKDLFDELYCGVMSEEVLIGTGRGGISLRNPIIANEEGFRQGKAIDYVDKGKRENKAFFVHGAWRNREDYFEHARSTRILKDYIGINFQGREAYSVISSSRLDPVRFYLLLDSEPINVPQRGKDVSVDADGKTYVLADEPRLYYLLKNLKGDNHELKLYTQDEGASVYSFTFGNQCLTEFERL